MFLQGNLQRVFDALYEMGMIEPVLEMDWSQAMEAINHNPEPLYQIVSTVNDHKGDQTDLIQQLKKFDEKYLSYLAMEVAREYADFHSRNQVH